MLPLCSAPLIVLLVAGEDWSLFLVGTWIFLLGYHNISYLINASIYLVKGGRSALCLVFCSTLAALVSVISVLCSRILHSLHGWVIMGTPWQFALNKTPPAMPNLGFTIYHLAFFLGFRGLKGHLYFKPSGLVLLWVLVQTRALCSATSGKLEAWF